MDATARPATPRSRTIAAMIGGALLWLLVLPTPPATAHPLGNFTVSTYAGLRIGPDAVAVDFVVDLAEIATVQARDFADADADRQVDDTEWAAYARAGCTRWVGELELAEEATPLELRIDGVDHRVQPGEGGAPTLRVECALNADRGRSEGERRITFADETFPDRQGWREVTAAGDRTTLLSSTVGEHSRSNRLTAYPEADLNDPVDVRTAEVVVEAGGLAASGGSTADGVTDAADILGTGAWVSALDEVMADGLVGEGLATIAVLAALALGALHALAPGHGKTLIAAYLIGQHGSLRHAGALALSVALTHTAGVLVLGAAVWTASVAAPERLYPLLGVVSGVIIVGVGLALLLRQRDHHHHQHHAELPSLAARRDSVEPPREPLRGRTVVALGFAGGLVPTPSALLVLLAALSVGRLGFGILLVACYGVGMALALVGIGAALSHARGRLDHRLERVGSARLHALSHALPQITASIVMLAGVVVIARSIL